MSISSDACFDLTLTEEQRITRESIRRFAAAEIRPVARSCDEAAAVSHELYQQANQLGLTLMPIPEAYGGAGMERSPISNMLNAEDLSYGDMSIALGVLAPASFVNALLDFGTEEQQERLLTPLASEDFVAATIALQEPRALFEPTQMQTTASKVADGYSLSGEKSMVIMAENALYILVLAKLEGSEDIAGFVVSPQAEGVAIEKEAFMGLRPLQLCKLTLQQVKVADNDRVEVDLQRLLDLSDIGTCAIAAGCCQAVLDYVVPYVNERVAFGEPISHRQSVAFMVADMATEVEAMRMLVYRAASRAEQGLEFHQQAYLCKLFCAEHAMEIGSNGVQLLGGHGFIREHPVEMWYRNLRAVSLLQGVLLV